MSESVDVQHIEGPVDANGDPNFGFSDADVALIKAKLSEPKIFVNGRLRFRDEPLPETDPEDCPATVMDELNLLFLDSLCEEDLDGMEYYLALGAEVNHRNPGCNETPLHFAVCRDDPKFARWLIARGADLEAKAVEGMRPLHWAVRLGNLELVKVLVEAGAQLHPQNDKGVIPYWWTNREQVDCKVPEERRKAIQALLPGAPITQILSGRGPIVFGRDDPAEVRKQKRMEAEKEKNKGRAPKNPAERVPHVP